MTTSKLSPIQISTLLRRFDIHPKKSLGQNFLADENALRKVVAAADLSAQDLVLEVGPGLGSLTRYLAVHARQVVAVELDQNLLPPLREVLRPFQNVQLLHGDILAQNIQELLSPWMAPAQQKNYAVVANIPYYITSALIRHLLEASLKPDRIILTLQKEVALRICAEPPEMSLLALGVQVYGRPHIETRLPAGNFYPVPKVDSAVLRINVYPTPLIPPPYTELFFRLAKAGFSQKRKNLRNTLSSGLRLPKNQVETLLDEVGIDSRRRAETLLMTEWDLLTRRFNSTNND